MLPLILPALHALDQKLHLYLIVFLVSVFGFLRYVPLFWIPIDGLLVDFIIICVLICYISWYVDLSTVNFAFSHALILIFIATASGLSATRCAES